MKENTHRISEMVFDLALAPGVGGPADADALGWAVRSELLSPIEEVLDAYEQATAAQTKGASASLR